MLPAINFQCDVKLKVYSFLPSSFSFIIYTYFIINDINFMKSTESRAG